jgi:hypothetical protein
MDQERKQRRQQRKQRRLLENKLTPINGFFKDVLQL